MESGCRLDMMKRWTELPVLAVKSISTLLTTAPKRLTTARTAAQKWTEVKKMNEDYTKLKDFAQKRLGDSCENDDDYDIRYWVGYIDGLNALQKRMDGGKQNEL